MAVLALPHARHRDATVRLRDVPVSRPGIKVESGDDIGLRPNRHYRILRPPSEIMRAAPTLDGVPILLDHDDRGYLVIGCVERARCDYGRDFAMFADPTLDGWAADLVALGALPRELSVGWGGPFRYEMNPGWFDGQPYDGELVGMTARHLAVVERGWAGPDYSLPL